jgi:hypothetical protein
LHIQSQKSTFFKKAILIHGVRYEKSSRDKHL